MYVCTDCGKNFTRGDNLRRHQRQSCIQPSHDGSPPAKQFRADTFPSTSTNMQTCNCCNVTLTTSQMKSHKRTLQHRTRSCVPMTNGVEIVQSAFRNRIVTYRVHSENNHIDYTMFFNEIRPKILNLLEEVLKIHKAIKVNMETFARYILPTQDLVEMKSFNTSNRILDESMDLRNILDSFVDSMIMQTTEFQERDSGKLIFIKIWE